MSRPTVSVIIPAYRAAHTIGRAVESVLNQTRPPDEVLVVDDGSPDDVADALAPYGEQVRLFRKANGGASSARNYGLDRCAGDLIAFLDADDYWEPQKLEKQLAVLERWPQVGVVAGKPYLLEPGGERTVESGGESWLYDRVWAEPRGRTAFTIARQISTIMVLFRRDALGAERFDEGLTTAEDLDLWIRLVLRAPSYLGSEPLATGVLVPGSLSRSDPAADCRNMLTVVRRHAALLGPAGTAAWETQIYRDWAAWVMGAGDPVGAVRPACIRLMREPWRPQAWWIAAKAAVWATGSIMKGATRRRAGSRRRPEMVSVTTQNSGG